MICVLYDVRTLRTMISSTVSVFANRITPDCWQLMFSILSTNQRCCRNKQRLNETHLRWCFDNSFSFAVALPACRSLFCFDLSLLVYISSARWQIVLWAPWKSQHLFFCVSSVSFNSIRILICRFWSATPSACVFRSVFINTCFFCLF